MASPVPLTVATARVGPSRGTGSVEHEPSPPIGASEATWHSAPTHALPDTLNVSGTSWAP
jgi:hypothetical protein